MRTPTSTTTTSPNRRTRISRRWRRISATRSDARGRLRRGVWTRRAPGHANEGADMDEDAATGAPTPCCMGDCSRLLSRALRWCPGRRRRRRRVARRARHGARPTPPRVGRVGRGRGGVRARRRRRRRSRRSTRRVGRLGPVGDRAAPRRVRGVHRLRRRCRAGARMRARVSTRARPPRARVHGERRGGREARGVHDCQGGGGASERIGIRRSARGETVGALRRRCVGAVPGVGVGPESSGRRGMGARGGADFRGTRRDVHRVRVASAGRGEPLRALAGT